MNVVFAPKACGDLAAAHQHIARENPGAADREVAKILDALTLLASGGVDGREVILRARSNAELDPGRSRLVFAAPIDAAPPALLERQPR